MKYFEELLINLEHISIKEVGNKIELLGKLKKVFFSNGLFLAASENTHERIMSSIFSCQVGLS